VSTPKPIHEPIHAPVRAGNGHGAFTPFTLDHETAGQPIHELVHAIHAQAIHDRHRACKARGRRWPTRIRCVVSGATDRVNPRCWSLLSLSTAASR
jgi:hypothetical protein